MKNEENKTYDAILLRAEATTDEKHTVSLLSEAIELSPDTTEAYLKLVDIYKADTVFTMEEENEFLPLINRHLSELKKQKDYPNLAFEIGKMYWYYYEYGKTGKGDNKITRMKSAIPWFEDVLSYGDQGFEKYNMAAVYASIGKFNRDITLSIEEASDQGSYAPYFKSLDELLKLVDSSENESEIVRLELYSIITSSIEVYARKFEIDGVSKESLFGLYDSILEKVKGTDALTDKTEVLKRYVLGREKDVRLIVDSAYEKSKK